MYKFIHLRRIITKIKFLKIYIYDNYLTSTMYTRKKILSNDKIKKKKKGTIILNKIYT